MIRATFKAAGFPAVNAAAPDVDAGRQGYRDAHRLAADVFVSATDIAELTDGDGRGDLGGSERPDSGAGQGGPAEPVAGRGDGELGVAAGDAAEAEGGAGVDGDGGGDDIDAPEAGDDVTPAETTDGETTDDTGTGFPAGA